MSEQLPSIDDFYEELPSVEEVIKEENLPSVDEFIEKEEEEIVEETIEEPVIEEAEDLTEVIRLINDVRRDIPDIPEIKYYDEPLEKLAAYVEQIKESIPEIPEIKEYDNEVEAICEQIDLVREEIKDLPEVKYYDDQVTTIEDRIDNLQTEVTNLPEVKYYDREIEAICEAVDQVKAAIPKFPKWVNEVNEVPDFTWIGKTFSVIDDDFIKVNDHILDLKTKFDCDIDTLSESLDIKDFERRGEVGKVKEDLKETKDKIYEELKETAIKIYEHQTQFKDDDRKLKKSILSKLNEARQNIEKQIAESYSKSYESNKTLKTYFEGLKEEIASLPEPKYYDNPIKDLKEGLSKLDKKREEQGFNITELYRIVEELKETQSKYASDTDPGRPIGPDPKLKQGKDPLTATDQQFATLKDLASNYRLFVNRVEQQLYTIGGGGAGFLKDLADVNIDGLKNKDTLVWNSTTSMWDVGSVGGASTTWTHDSVGIHTLSNVGIATTARADYALYVGGNMHIEGDLVYDEVTGTNLNISGIATVGTLYASAGIVTANQFVSSSTTLPFYPPVMTTTQRDAMTVTQGAMIFNSTSKKMEFYDGTSWNTLPGMSLGLTVALDG